MQWMNEAWLHLIKKNETIFDSWRNLNLNYLVDEKSSCYFS